MIDDFDLQNRFMHHPPTSEDQAKTYEVMRGKCIDLARHVVNQTPECREQSLAITKIEEAMFWANAATARHSG